MVRPVLDLQFSARRTPRAMKHDRVTDGDKDNAAEVLFVIEPVNDISEFSRQVWAERDLALHGCRQGTPTKRQRPSCYSSHPSPHHTSLFGLVSRWAWFRSNWFRSNCPFAALVYEAYRHSRFKS